MRLSTTKANLMSPPEADRGAKTGLYDNLIRFTGFTDRDNFSLFG